MTTDFLVPNNITYLLVKICVLVLALLLWFTITALPAV